MILQHKTYAVSRTVLPRAAYLGIVAALALLPRAASFAQSAAGAPATVSIAIDAAAGRHAISPLIYGVNLATQDQLRQLNSSANRIGGNSVTRYNWKNNSSNAAADYFYESKPGTFFPYTGSSNAPSYQVDKVIQWDQASSAATLLTVPTLGWVAKVTDPNATLWSFSVAKYGPQQKADPGYPDAGNGVKPDGTPITGNDPNDANVPITPEYERPWIEHLVKKYGDALHGGVRFYLMDNEPALWQDTHRDVHPIPETSQEDLNDIVNYGTMVKSVDPAAQVCAPDEWGYAAIASSGADNVYSGAHNYTHDTPDRAARGGMDNLPWLLKQIRAHDIKSGHRLLDVLDMHIYPQGGDGNDDVSEKVELLRNRDTRSLWDPNYVDESWIKAPIALIPRLKSMIAAYYPGTRIGITEYNWGAEKSISGALAQADLLGIFGREGVFLATRWIAPDADTPTFKAMQMYRNYNGRGGMFGSIGVSDRPSSNPDDLASFAALRRVDGAMTIMALNKQLHNPTQAALRIAHFRASKTAQVYQLTSAGEIVRLADIPTTGSMLALTLPAQSITLIVVPASDREPLR